MIARTAIPARERMLSYYPPVIQNIVEFQAIMDAEGIDIDLVGGDLTALVNEAYLSEMGVERIVQWEQALGLVYDADDTLQDRRDAIIARIRGQGKLNTELISSIVNAFTSGTATSYIEDSVLYVKIKPPLDNKEYKFTNIERELSKKKPAHLGLSVTRDYFTWGELRDNFRDWNQVSDFVYVDEEGVLNRVENSFEVDENGMLNILASWEDVILLTPFAFGNENLSDPEVQVWRA